MSWFLLFVAISGAACAGLGLIAARAPVGYQDERGFHYGTKTDLDRLFPRARGSTRGDEDGR